jgi:hypothetical protein
MRELRKIREVGGLGEISQPTFPILSISLIN